MTYMTEKRRDPKIGKKQINFRLRNIHRQGLEKMARKHGSDMTEEIHVAIRRYLEAEGVWDATVEGDEHDEGK